MTSLPHSPDLDVRAKAIRLVAFDIDGTLTDGRLVFDSEGRELKAFHSQDGMGIALLVRHGFEVAFVTARHSGIVEARGRELKIQHVYTGEKNKGGCIRDLSAKLGLKLSEVAFMGDDLPDLEIMRTVGLAAVPSDAHPCVKQIAHFESKKAGGRGGARELCDMLLESQGFASAIYAAEDAQ